MLSENTHIPLSEFQWKWRGGGVQYLFLILSSSDLISLLFLFMAIISTRRSMETMNRNVIASEGRLLGTFSRFSPPFFRRIFMAPIQGYLCEWNGLDLFHHHQVV